MFSTVKQFWSFHHSQDTVQIDSPHFSIRTQNKLSLMLPSWMTGDKFMCLLGVYHYQKCKTIFFFLVGTSDIMLLLHFGFSFAPFDIHFIILLQTQLLPLLIWSDLFKFGTDYLNRFSSLSTLFCPSTYVLYNCTIAHFSLDVFIVWQEDLKAFLSSALEKSSWIISLIIFYLRFLSGTCICWMLVYWIALISYSVIFTSFKKYSTFGETSQFLIISLLEVLKN